MQTRTQSTTAARAKAPVVRTKEGLSIRKVRHFPSMEYGEEGGTSCDILLNGKPIADYLDVGDGGEARVTYYDPAKRSEYNTLFQDAIMRIDPASVSKYGEQIVRDCATTSLVNYLMDAKELLKVCLKWSAKGYNHMMSASYQHGFQTASIGFILKPGEKPESNPFYAKRRKSLADCLKVSEDDPDLEINVYCEEDFGSL